jgi:hypothetical protein
MNVSTKGIPMSNRHAPAYPKPGDKGITKLELAAIQIAAGFCANPDETESTAKMACARASAVFDELDRLEAERLEKMDGEA